MCILIAGVLSATEQPEEAFSPPECGVGMLNEMQSRILCELDETVNDLQRKVATVLLDNTQQQEEFSKLKERLVEALEAEVNWHLAT